MKLSHGINKFYLIKLDSLFDDLSNENFFVDVDTFLAMFGQVGNETINSLIEFRVDEAIAARSGQLSRDEFIREKYVKKRFVNPGEIDYTRNYHDELNRLLCTSASGRSLPMTIYYLFLGASLSARTSGRTPLEASDMYQSIYLFLQVRFYSLIYLNYSTESEINHFRKTRAHISNNLLF